MISTLANQQWSCNGICYYSNGSSWQWKPIRVLKKILENTAWWCKLGRVKNDDGSHLCVSPYKEFEGGCKKTLPVSNRKIGMWIFWLLMNRDNMQDLERAVKLVVIIMCSKLIAPRVRLFIGTLNKLIKDFKINMWCVARFGAICTISKTWKTPMEEC